LPEFALNPLSIHLVNAMIQRIQAHASPVGHYEAFFYPLDKIANWNRGYLRDRFSYSTEHPGGGLTPWC
jgi:decaprenylphospho-beta-D-ribofuranose 2-oxidase